MLHVQCTHTLDNFTVLSDAKWLLRNGISASHGRKFSLHAHVFKNKSIPSQVTIPESYVAT